MPVKSKLYTNSFALELFHTFKNHFQINVFMAVIILSNHSCILNGYNLDRKKKHFLCFFSFASSSKIHSTWNILFTTTCSFVDDYEEIIHFWNSVGSQPFRFDCKNLDSSNYKRNCTTNVTCLVVRGGIVGEKKDKIIYIVLGKLVLSSTN